MNQSTKSKIELYIDRKIMPSSMKELRELVMYLRLIRLDEYAQISAYINNLYEFPGFDNISRGVYKLDSKFARRYLFFKRINLIKLIFDLCKSKSDGVFNPSRKKQREYFMEVLEGRVKQKVVKSVEIFNLEIVKLYPEILSELFKRTTKSNYYGIKLRRAQIVVLITAILTGRSLVKPAHTVSPNHAVTLANILADQYLNNKTQLEILFQYEATPGQIREHYQALKEIKEFDFDKIFRRAKDGHFITKGAYYAVPPGVKAALKTLVFCSLPATGIVIVLLQVVMPLIPGMVISPFVPPLVYALASILTFFVGEYYNHSRQKHEYSNKRKAMLKLASKIYDYLALLIKKEVDVTGVHRYWGGQPITKRRSESYVPNRNLFSPGSPLSTVGFFGSPRRGSSGGSEDTLLSQDSGDHLQRSEDDYGSDSEDRLAVGQDETGTVHIYAGSEEDPFAARFDPQPLPRVRLSRLKIE